MTTATAIKTIVYKQLWGPGFGRRQRYDTASSGRARGHTTFHRVPYCRDYFQRYPRA